MIKILLVMLPAIICISAAATMAVLGIPQWGWFLFAGIILLMGLEIKNG